MNHRFIGVGPSHRGFFHQAKQECPVGRQRFALVAVEDCKVQRPFDLSANAKKLDVFHQGVDFRLGQ